MVYFKCVIWLISLICELYNYCWSEKRHRIGNSGDIDGCAPSKRPPLVGGETSQGRLAIWASCPNHRVDKTLLQVSLDSFPSDPWRVFPWNTTQSPGWQDQDITGHFPLPISSSGTSSKCLKVRFFVNYFVDIRFQWNNLHQTFMVAAGHWVIFASLELPGEKPFVPPMRSFNKFQRWFQRHGVNRHPNWADVFPIDWVISLIMMPRGRNSCWWLFYKNMLVIKNAK